MSTTSPASFAELPVMKGPEEDIEKRAGEDSTSFEDGAQQQLPWDDPRESRNTKNWSFLMRLFHTAIPCFLAFEITFATSITVPATSQIMQEFSVSRTKSILPLTLYTIGLAIGPLFIAPFSEVIGRKWVYAGSCTFLLAFLGGASATSTFSGLLACRFIAGTLGSAGIAVGAGTIADVWELGKGAGASLLYILGPFLGPTLGPLAGAYILHDRNNDWRWTQYVLLMVGAPIWVGTMVMKETSKAWILRKESGEERITLARLGGIVRTAVMRPTKMLFTEIIVSSLAIYTAFAYAMIFSYFGSCSYVLQKYYGFNLREVGLSFLSIIIGYILATFVFAFLDAKFRLPAVRAGKGFPEQRLYAALVGSVALPVGLFWYAWEAHRGGHWAALVAAGIPFGLGAFCLFLSVITYMVDFYGQKAAASALAANGILRYILGAVFPLFTLQIYEKLGVHWAGSVFAFLSLPLIPIPWLLFKYGGQLRQKSNFVST
ncbi:major facilitator superfamily transporter [Colletotrichum orchidophilum]|uniref:Major facilitator superfamily transporter n=1 Tax=Colletotrichum orchidophilum TaxID=1209926 RepID=A0A1G4AYH8_9PEZI|nr:major facilitator superfamily transporter [Colletotrichum orchidophilum]OHE94197.1 major facilitator superfamily transporter [Colletotrichum orchidophilum]